ncbi:MAG: hypothetical protein ACYDA8_12780 [Deferrisomatales bacterium]
MADIAELTSDGKLALPGDVANRFRPSDRFLVWAEGDTVHLKRISRTRLTDLVSQATDEEPMSAEEIAEEVHEHRREKRGA